MCRWTPATTRLRSTEHGTAPRHRLSCDVTLVQWLPPHVRRDGEAEASRRDGSYNSLWARQLGEAEAGAAQDGGDWLRPKAGLTRRLAGKGESQLHICVVRFWLAATASPSTARAVRRRLRSVLLCMAGGACWAGFLPHCGRRGLLYLAPCACLFMAERARVHCYRARKRRRKVGVCFPGKAFVYLFIYLLIYL